MTTLHAVLRETAERCPDRTAVVADDRELTYAELDRRAEHLAAELAARGVRGGDRVGICLDKSAAAIIAVHGVLKAGAAYVPIAADQPPARAAYIIRDAGIAVVLTDGSAVRALADPDRPAELVVDATCPLPDSIVPPAVSTATDDIAYVLYTSGSTGTPKGVLLSHRNALSFVDWAVRRFGLRPEDRMSNHAPLNFDLSVLDLFGAARAGAAVVVVPRSVAAFPASVVEFIAAQRISVWYSVPTALAQMSVRGGLSAAVLPSLRLVLFAGEVFPVPRLRRRWPTFRTRSSTTSTARPRRTSARGSRCRDPYRTTGRTCRSVTRSMASRSSRGTTRVRRFPTASSANSGCADRR